MVLEARQKLPPVLSYHPLDPKTVENGSIDAELTNAYRGIFGANALCVIALILIDHLSSFVFFISVQ